MASLSSIKLTPGQNIIAGIFIVIILITLVLRLYASNRELALAGPHFLVANDTTILTVYNTELFHLDPAGHIVEKIPLSKLGITTKVADIQLLGDNRFVIGDWDNERILLCHLSELTCQSLTQNLNQQIRNFFKFHYRVEENDIFIGKKPYASWTLNASTASWNAPIAEPNLTSEQESQNEAGTHKWVYEWNETAYQADNTAGWDLSNQLA